VPLHAGHPPIMYLPLPRHAEHMPSSQCELKPIMSKSLPRNPGDLVDQVQFPVPEHARQMSTLPKPSHPLHLTSEEPTLPIRICVPQYIQYAFGEFSGTSRFAPHLGHIAGISFTSATIPHSLDGIVRSFYMVLPGIPLRICSVSPCRSGEPTHPFTQSAHGTCLYEEARQGNSNDTATHIPREELHI